MLKELLEKRRLAIEQSRGLLDKADKEKRALSTEEREQYDAWDKEIDSLSDRIEREEKQVKREAQMGEYRGTGGVQYADKPTQTQATAKRDEKEVAEEQRKAFQNYLKFGAGELTPDERRALQQGIGPQGGFLVPGEQFVATLLQKVDDLFFLRALATKYTITGAQSLGVPSLETDLNDADWTTELATGSEDTALRLGKRQLKPNPMAKRVKISNTLLQNAVIAADTLVLERMAYVFAKTMEKAFLTGDGNEKPLGLFTASADGISTGRDVSTDNTTTAVTFDGLINAKYSVKSQYWARAGWLFHRDGVKQIRKIKNAVDGNYVWEPSVRVGEPDTILNAAVYMSEYVPNTFTTGLYVGMYGDFSKYWIADSMGMSVQRLNELYAEANQVGFIGRMSSDAMPALEEAFARVKLA